MTAQVYSVLYYASQVWLTNSTLKKYWKIVSSLHYRGLRLILGKRSKMISRKNLDQICGRASPREWSQYSIAMLAIKCLRDGQPQRLNGFIREHMFHERRKPERPKFYCLSNLAVGKQAFYNQLGHLGNLTTPWENRQQTDDEIRRMLKSAYFEYFKTTDL